MGAGEGTGSDTMKLHTSFTGDIDNLKTVIEELKKIFQGLNESINTATITSKASTAASKAQAAAIRAETQVLKAKKAQTEALSDSEKKNLQEIKAAKLSAIDIEKKAYKSGAEAISEYEVKAAEARKQAKSSVSAATKAQAEVETSAAKKVFLEIEEITQKEKALKKAAIAEEKELAATRIAEEKRVAAEIRKAAKDEATEAKRIAKERLTLERNKQKEAKKTAELLAHAGSGADRELNEYEAAQARAANETVRFRRALSELSTVHGREGTALKTVEQQLYKVEGALQRQAQEMVQTGKWTKEQADNFLTLANRTKLYQKILSKDVTIKDGFLSRVKEDIEKIQPKIGPLAAGFERLKSSFKSLMAYSLSGSLIFGVVNALRGGVTAITEYDQSLKALQAITSATDAEVSVMGETIKDVARTTKFSTSEVASGMTLIGQAGFNATESIQAIQGVSDLATGTLSEMQETTDLVTTTIRAFGMSAAETTTVVDVMANAVNKSKLTIGKLNTAFNYVGSVAHQAGLSLQETAASMMVLADNGMRASTVSTGLRQVLSRMISPSKSIREEFEAQNIDLKELDIRTNGFQRSLQSLSKALKDPKTGLVDMAKAFSLFGLRGAQAAAILVSSYSGSFQKALNNVYSVGTAQEMAAKQAEGLGIKVKNLYDRFKLLAVALGQAGVTGALGSVLDALRALTQNLEKLINSDFGKFIVIIGGTVAALYSLEKVFLLLRGLALTSMFISWGQAIAAYTLSVIGLRDATVAATAAQAAFNIVADTNPYVLVVTAIATLAASLYAYVKLSKDFVTQTAEAIVSLKDEQEKIQSTTKEMERFKDATADTLATSNEWQKYLNKIFKEHKELYQMVDRNTVSYNELREALIKLQQAKALEQWKKENVILDDLAEKLRTIKKEKHDLEHAKTIPIAKLILTRTSADDKQTELINQEAEATQNLKNAIDGRIEKMAQEVAAGTRAQKNAEVNIKTIKGLSDIYENTAEVIDYFNKRVKEISKIKDINSIVETMSKETKSLIGDFDKIFAKLSVEQQKRYLDAMSKNKTWAAATKKPFAAPKSKTVW